jgi:hypothetical protein
MGTKNILAYFKTPDEAEKVAKYLQSIGVKDVKIDRFSKYPGDGVEEIMNPITGKISSLANLTSDANVAGRDIGILAAADISASGLSDGGQEITGRDILLAAAVDEAHFHNALRVVKDAGGMI